MTVAGRRVWKPLWTVTVLLLLLAYTTNSNVDAFKIRSKNKDLPKDSKNLVDSSAEETTSRKRLDLFDDERDNIDDEDDDNIEILTDDEENQNERNELRKSEEFVFTKVRKAHASIPDKNKKIRKKSDNDGDRDSVDDDDLTATRNLFDAVVSWFSSVGKQKSAEPVIEPSKQSEPKKESATAQKYANDSKVTGKNNTSGDDQDGKKVKSKKKTKAKGWRSYLEKLPLGFLNSFIAEGQTNEDYDDEPQFTIELPKALKPTAQIIEDVMKSVKEKISKPKKKPPPSVSMPYEEFEKILLNVPSFVPNYTKIHNFECQMQGQIFERQLRGHKPWTHQMIDSTAKITTGLLRGNMNQLGDYDLCTGIGTKVKITNEESVKIRGKYCLAHIEITAFEEDLKKPLHLIQGKGLLKSSLDDPSHFIPRFTITNWGMCMPAACDSDDAERMMTNFLKPYNCTGLRVQIHVDPKNCYVHAPQNYAKIVRDNWQIPATLLFYSFCIVCTVVATMSDYSKELKLDKLYTILFKSKSKDGENSKENDERILENEKIQNSSGLHQVLMAFSLKSTSPLLFNADDGSDEDQVRCIHGIKAIGTVLLFIALRAIPLGRMPFDNRNEMTDLFNQPISMLVRGMFLYTDLFLFLSGLLCSYGVVKDIKFNGKLFIVKRTIGRIVRLVPTLLAVLLFYAYVWEYIGNGPQWGDLVIKNSELCKRGLWKNLLFIQNWLPFESICATHTFQLAIDMQLYVLTPLLVWIFYKNPMLGLGTYGILHGFSTGARFTSVADNRLSFVFFHGMKLSQIYRTANLALSKTVHRASPYLIGIGLGIALRDFEKTVKIPKAIVRLSWLSSFCGLFWCFWAPSHLASRTYQYESAEVAQYAALSSLVFSLSLAWIIFACNFGYGSSINRLLSSKPMLFVSRLSYSIYLIEFIVFFTFAAHQRHTEHFELAKYINGLELVVLLLAALVLTLIIDLPMQNIRRILLGAMQVNTDANKSETKALKEKEMFKDAISIDKEAEDENVVKPTESGYSSSYRGNSSPRRELPPPPVTKEPTAKDTRKTVSPWDDTDEVYVPQFRRNNESDTRRMSPREYFKSSFDEQTTSPSPHWSSTSNEFEKIGDEADEELESDEEEIEEIMPEPTPVISSRPTRRRWNWEDD